ncbi:MAG: hypothetical protein GTO14_21265 [Anaerolineales bacterium]|nr:hypothetical protein [Anaerolineales bacterium]
MRLPSPTSWIEPIKRWFMRLPYYAHWSKTIREVSRITWKVLLARNRTGAVVRLLLFSTTFAFYWFLIVVLKGFPGEIPNEWGQDLGPILFLLLNMFAPFVQPEVLVYLLPVLGSMLFGLFIGALYLTDLFELESYWIAVRYLLGSILGLSYPSLRIDQGDVEALEAENSINPLIRIGGPGYVDVHLGFAAVFETESGHPRVLSSLRTSAEPTKGPRKQSSRFIEGFTRLRDVVDLRDRHSKLDEVLAVTREGVEVYARDTQMVFRVHSGDQERTLENPYPYDERGIRRLVYGQAVSKKGLSQWESILPSIVKIEIRDFVARRKVEDFLAMQPHRIPEDEVHPHAEEAAPQEVKGEISPRRDLSERFHTDDRKSRLKDRGLELTWVGVGAWEVRDDKLSHTPREVGPGKIILSAWRDYQLTRRLRTEGFVDRKRYQAFQDRIADTLTTLIHGWEQHELRRSDRCFEVLIRFREKLMEIYLHLDRKAEGDTRYQAIMEHLDKLIGPSVLGGLET